MSRFNRESFLGFTSGILTSMVWQPARKSVMKGTQVLHHKRNRLYEAGKANYEKWDLMKKKLQAEIKKNT
ncbi:hypothetical protein MUN89_03410 [Halobacillus salinarum]|uniref:YtxH domain-containing protein n=1 Tax=Halobacillus salinarum TaxID=2932257 RepID=A0ABY4EMX7_9BACI|nr:hypothetical protein [Halobacillus salinarum]UOQ45014.1 hypothetical protein MUN89_03410 [Halobacillus salinarum]